jgi:hypothetical protein
MALIRENRSIRRKTCPGATLPTTNFTRNGLGGRVRYPGLSDDERLRCRLIIVKMSSPYLAVNTLLLVMKTSQLMLYREIISVCSEIHTKHKNTLYG